MKRTNNKTCRAFLNGFTLPAILVIVAALLIMVIGLLALSGIERRTARSYVDYQRADLAARAGLEDVKAILQREAANDDFTVISASLKDPIKSGKTPAPALMIARGETGGTGLSFRYTPLFSAENKPLNSPILKSPEIEDLFSAKADERLDFTALPYNDDVRASWVQIKDSKDGKERLVGRYAFWVEDLQGNLDPKIPGEMAGGGTTTIPGVRDRNKWPFSAPGINPEAPADDQPALDQIAINVLDPSDSTTKPSSLAKNLADGRETLISPGSALAAAGIAPVLERVTTENGGDPKDLGRLVNTKARALEESVAPTLQKYEEQPLIPYALGISPNMSGKPKVNLNAMLAKGGADAVSEISSTINSALPKFIGRSGGFTEDYVATIAANAIDYADDDPSSTFKQNAYRGLDGFPLVSEFLQRVRWDKAIVENDRKKVVVTVTLYAELWNMTTELVTGIPALSIETRYHAPLGANPKGVKLDDFTNASPVPVSDGKYHWLSAIKFNGKDIKTGEVTLQPNEYQVITFQPIEYKFDAGPATFFVPKPISLGGEQFGASNAGYRLKWNGQIVDQARGGIHRNDASIYLPADHSKDQYQEATRTTIPGLSGNRNTFQNSMGDPRISYYLTIPQDANAYPENYSPARKTIRYGSIYSIDTATKMKFYGRVMPSEWPDGGHNASYGQNNFYTTAKELEPDISKFFVGTPNPEIKDSPTRLSRVKGFSNKSQRFYSATELGRIYDPAMWNVTSPSSPGIPWGDVKSGTLPSGDYGGGNTLRIGRPEHPAWNRPDMHAARLLDLFHTGMSRSEDDTLRKGPLVQINGNVNINTANRHALRAIAAGPLQMDPNLYLRTADAHTIGTKMAPPTAPLTLRAPQQSVEADRVADAIIRGRPYASPSELAGVIEQKNDNASEPSAFKQSDGSKNSQVQEGVLNIFGNREMYSENSQGGRKNTIEWTDSAAEELFARVYEASTVRSRNFRVWVVGQSIVPTSIGNAKPEVLAEVRKVFTIFADPGARESDGSINPKKNRTVVLHENSF